jgi:hypothetical protein
VNCEHLLTFIRSFFVSLYLRTSESHHRRPRQNYRKLLDIPYSPLNESTEAEYLQHRLYALPPRLGLLQELADEEVPIQREYCSEARVHFDLEVLIRERLSIWSISSA